MPKDESVGSGKSQLAKFKEAAREVETDDREEAFDAVLKKISKAPPPKDKEPPKRKSV